MIGELESLLTTSKRTGNKTELQTHCCFQWNVSQRLETKEEPPLSSLGIWTKSPVSSLADTLIQPGPGRMDVTMGLSGWDKNKCRNKSKAKATYSTWLCRQNPNSKNPLKSLMLKKWESGQISESEEKDEKVRKIFPWPQGDCNPHLCFLKDQCCFFTKARQPPSGLRLTKLYNTIAHFVHCYVFN